MHTNSLPSNEQTHAQYQQTFNYITVLIPQLLNYYVGDMTKGIELDNLLKDVSFLVVHITL